MRTSVKLCTGFLVVLSGAAGMAAQDMTGPPPVLVIQREFLKPGKSGMMHEKSEAAFVNAMTAAKWPTHYFAAESMSGAPRVLFLSGYPTFEAWEKDNHAIEKNATLSAAIDRATVADGELLSEYNQSAFVFHPEASLRTGEIAHSRYFEISQYKVKPGHRAEWMELVKAYRDGYEKAVPDANWAFYESYYGADNGGYYIAITRMTSLSEVDKEIGDDKKFSDAMGPATMKKLEATMADCLESQQTNLFSFNPKMSYPMDEWIKADPFWKPKAAAAKKAAAPATP